jgi:hypothetical protein
MTERKRPTASALTNVAASCEVCSWGADTVNALALAARHHDATGHQVTTSITRLVVYGDDVTPEELGQTTLEELA